MRKGEEVNDWKVSYDITIFNINGDSILFDTTTKHSFKYKWLAQLFIWFLRKKNKGTKYYIAESYTESP